MSRLKYPVAIVDHKASGKDIDIIKVITHADGGEPYSNSVSHYPSNEDSVAVKGYGVVDNDPETAQMQFDIVTKYYGNNGKNQYIQFMMSFLTETAPDAAKNGTVLLLNRRIIKAV